MTSITVDLCDEKTDFSCKDMREVVETIPGDGAVTPSTVGWRKFR